MQETIVRIEKATAKNKKYSAFVKNKITKKVRKINFGSSINEQYKDSTPLKTYASKDHGDKKRRKQYFQRFSNVPTKAQALAKERRSGKYTPKLLSHMYLWIVALTIYLYI